MDDTVSGLPNQGATGAASAASTVVSSFLLRWSNSAATGMTMIMPIRRGQKDQHNSL